MDRKLKRCTSSSQEIVMDEEDLLTLILLRLPYQKLKSFKFVSKQWHSLITAPHFTRLLRDVFPPLRASALIMQYKPFFRKHNEAYLVSLDDRNTPSPFPFRPQEIRIKQSCNGLLLCFSIIIICNTFKRNRYVYNLSTNHLDTLPEHPLDYRLEIVDHYFALAYDPLKSLHYKVIAFVSTPLSNSVDDLHIYSSETGTWKPSIRSFIRAPGMILENGVYWNGCIHWLSVSDCFYFNVDEERFEPFPSPPFNPWWLGRIFYFGESEDHLHVIDYRVLDSSLNVYEMKSDYSEWFVKYQIDLAPISQFCPETIVYKVSPFSGKKIYLVGVLSLIRREKFQEDSFLVLEIPGKVIRYNLVDRSFKLIWDFSVTLNLKNSDHWSGNFQVCQYSEFISCA